MFVFVFVSSESFPILFCCVHGNVPPLSLQSLPTNIGSHTDEGIGRPTYMLLKRRNGFQSKTNLAWGMCFWWRRWYIQTGFARFLEVDFVPISFVKSNKKNNSRISLWYKLTYVGMCIKFRLKTDLERRFLRRDWFWWRGWYIQDSAPYVWGNTRQSLRLLFEFCKEHSCNWRIADNPLDHIWLNWVPEYGQIRCFLADFPIVITN